MSFMDDIATDVAAFLTEFGEAAIFNGTDSITVIYDNPSGPVLDTETGGVMIPGPQAIAQESDVPDAKGKTLKVNEITYNIIESMPDGTGMTTLKLSKD